MSIPLYDELLARRNAGEKVDQQSLAAKIRNLTNEQHRRIVQALILHNFLVCEGKTIPDRPKVYLYGSKIQEGGRGILYQVEKLPQQLQEVLWELVKVVS